MRGWGWARREAKDTYVLRTAEMDDHPLINTAALGQVNGRGIGEAFRSESTYVPFCRTEAGG
jgi:hypothetical protein